MAASSRERKITSPTEALAKAYRFCAYQERSHAEVRRKLGTMGLTASYVDEILAKLITEGYLNEERFAKAFAGGKFRMKKWGKVKIRHELEAHDLTSKCIEIALREIDDEAYRHTLCDIVRKKAAQTSEEDIYVRRDMVARYAIAKGYESELVWEAVKKLMV